MSKQVYSSALRSALKEIQNACPDVTSNFIFKDYEILAKTENITDSTVTEIRKTLNGIIEKADTIGGLEALTIQGAEGKVNVAALEDFHLTTVSSKQADEKYVNTLTRVLIPIVIKLVDEIQSALPETETITGTDENTETVEPEPFEAEGPEETIDESPEEVENNEDIQLEEPEEETPPVEDSEPVELDVYDEPLIPEPPVTQLIVENLGGLLVPSDTVRIGNDIVAQWKELYSDQKINEVEVEALNGKSTRCKFKKIKKSKDLGKGIIKMPEKIQLTLEIASGELVTVKPVVE